ncbi:MAG: hypothetical protein K2M60_07000, partial [Lachnospiraceae bacterium]|nr:hypothetical protein [Lachnospiraceae bacterium]
GGYTWRVNEINPVSQDIYVEFSKGKSRRLWEGKGGDIHDKIFKRMKQVLSENIDYMYLQENGIQRINEMRNYVRENGLLTDNFLRKDYDTFYYIPWVGSQRIRTLEQVMNIDYIKTRLSIFEVKYVNKYSFEIHTKYRGENFEYDLAKEVLKIHNEDLILDLPRNELYRDKYDEYISTELLRKSYVNDYLNLESLKEWAENIVEVEEFEGL